MGKIFKKIGSAVKKVGKFVKKHWVKILMAVAVVFTAGIATVGFAGFAGAMSVAGGGFGGFMSAVGSTLWAGATAIGGTMGIGPGAQGAAAVAGNVEGATLFSGHAAAAMGSESAKAGIAQQAAAKGALSPLMSNAVPAVTSGVPTAGELSPLMEAPGATGAVATPGGTTITPLVQKGAEEAAKGSLLADVGKQVAVQGAMGSAQGYFQGKAMEDDPLAFFGVNMNGKDAKFILPGQVNPKTGEPISEEEAKAYNEWYASGNKAGTFELPEPPPV